LRESLEEVLAHAERAGVGIGIEYEPGLLVERCEELVELLGQLSSPLLGANLDFGHSHLLGESPETVLAALGPKLFHLHIEDIGKRKHFHLIPGLGEIDFRRLFELLSRHDYQGFATVELYTYPNEPEAAAMQALQYLKNLKGDRTQP
jgi:fructoselysine 3-epimerase